jgi:hypothetical protein
MMFSKFLISVSVIVAAMVVHARADGLKIDVEFLPENCERKTKNGDYLYMHYTGSIDESSATGEKGKVFDSSHNRNQVFDFALGSGHVIKGWDQGLLDMCVGEKRVLTIPPELGYGASGAGGAIPGGATLKFEVECVKIGDVNDTPKEPNIFAQMDTDVDGKISYKEMETWFKKERNQEEIPKGLCF